MTRRVWPASKRQAPVVKRFDDLVELLSATSQALLDNAQDHQDPIDPDQIRRWQHELTGVSSALRVATQVRPAA